MAESVGTGVAFRVESQRKKRKKRREEKKRMKSPSYKCAFGIAAICLSLLVCAKARGEEWIFYSASKEAEDTGTLKDWYGLNRCTPVPKENASTLHFFDTDSLAPSSPLPGSITRIWEKSVTQKETMSYIDARLEIEKEEENKLKRKITALDNAWILPLAVKRATYETRTLYEIDCAAREFIILEVSHFDRDGNRMTRETNMVTDIWIPIEPGTVLEALFQKICN